MDATLDSSARQGPPDLLAAALDYAARGWRVVTVWRARNGACRCRKGKECDRPGKHPRTRHGLNGATAEEKRIRGWKWTTANIGIATGAESGLVVLDIDLRHNGQESLRQLEERLGKLPSGPVVATGGGGWHGYFAHPGRRVPSRNDVASGIDVRGDGGYVVAPPSIHAHGKPYCWRSPPSAPLKQLPDAWLDFLVPQCHRDGGDYQGPQRTTEDLSTTEDYPTDKGTPSRARLPAAAPGDLLNKHKDFVDQCIRKSLPRARGKRHDCVFKLARLLQGLPALAALPVGAFRPVVNRWYDLAVKELGEGKIAAGADENWWDFSEGWDKVKYPGEEGLMGVLLERARLKLPKIGDTYRDPQTRLLIGLCRELQREVGDAPFFLATSTAARTLGVRDPNGELDRKRAWRCLDGLVRDGILEQVDRGDAEKRVPATFRYVPPIDE